MRRRSIWAIAIALALSVAATDVRAAGCQTGVASAPFIGVADMRAIDRAARKLPKAPRRTPTSIGSSVPKSVKRAPVPRAVAKVLPQYAAQDYTAFRVGGRLAIANPGGTLSYLMPLGVASKPADCS